MGKSTSCFKIIACGNDSPDKDDLEASESKGSSDKRGWSFRKRSARHRVLSNTVITETPTSVHKESPESTALNFQPPVSTAVPEKISVKHCSDEKPRLLTPENPKVSEAEPKVPEAESKASETEPKILETGNAAEDESAVQCKLDESVAIVVQTAVRGSLAQRALVELKNVVKLQAVFRGYLVRKHAVGTLRCVQALVKVQAVVRARRARLSLEQEHEKDNHNSKTLEKKSLAAKSNIAYISIDQLLSNRFARQLLESTPRSKSIHLKCDSSKEDSSWKWMERWTAIASPGAAESNEPESLFEQQERQKEDTPYSLTESKIQDEVLFDIPESKSSMKESIVPSDSEENLISYDADNLNQLEQPQLDKTSSSDIKEISDEISSLRNESMQSDADSQKELKSFSGKPRMESEQPKRSMKRLASEELETEGKKSVFGSRKVSNPAFIAAQSKFEVLSSTTNSDRPISPSHQDFDSILLQRDTFQSGVDTEVRAKEPSVTENPVSNGSRVQVGGSECGTEISISSTLDSPDISDVGAMEHENEEAKVSEEGICSPKSSGNGDVGFQPISAPDVPDAVLNQLEKLDVVHLESVNSVVAMDSPQVESKPERTTSDLQMEQDTEAGTQAAYGSPETSPRSHIPESQGTPSSLISVKGKRSKDDQSGSNPRRKSLSAGKKSPSKTNPDSATSKDQKNGKRRNSFGSAKPPTDQGDQEPRDSSSNSSIPHFMQATESARAKLQATTSPRSSPDLQDRDLYIKKRHSLPGANGRQGSPRIQRSTSQEKQAAKANERKWNR